MSEWDEMPLIELGRLIERMDMRLGQYEIHVNMLTRNCRDRKGAEALVKRMRETLVALREVRKRRVAEFIAPGAHIPVDRTVSAIAGRAGTSGSGRGQVCLKK